MKDTLKLKNLIFIGLAIFLFTYSTTILNKTYACCGYELPAPDINLEQTEEIDPEPAECPFGVNRATGNLTTYYSLPHSGVYAGLPIQLRLAHNSLDLSTGPLGRGWTHNYDIRLTGVDSVPIRANLFADNLSVSWWVSIEGNVEGRWFSRSWSGVGEIIDITWDGMARISPHWEYERVPDGNYTYNIWAWAPGTASSWITGTARLGTPVLVRTDGRRDVFTPTLDGTFTPEPGVYATLVRNPDRTFTLLEKDRTRYLFNPSGRLISITDRNNNTTTFTYDVAGNLILITDPAGRITTLSYDALGRIRVVTDPLGRTTTFTYDGAGNLITITDPLGNTTSYTYTAFNRIASISENGILRHSFEYDTTLRVTRATDALGNKTTYTYQPAYRRTTVTSPLWHPRVYTYDDRNNITSIIDPLGNITTFVYDEHDNLISQTDPLGRTTTFTYDLRGNRTSEKDPLGNITAFIYDQHNNLIRRTDPLGRTTTHTYDERGNLLKTTDPLGNRSTRIYDGRGNLLSTTDARGNTTTKTYDHFGNLISTTDPEGNTTTFIYNLVGRMISMTDARDNATRHTYDAVDNLIQVAHPDGTTTRYEYDCCLLIKVIDANNNTINYEYDAKRRLLKVTDALGNITRYTYDAVGNRTSIADANGNTTTYFYDANNRLIRVISPLRHITTFTYDAVGNQLTRTDAKRATTTYTYDKLNRLIRKLYPDGTRVTLTYDAIGNRLTMTDWLGTTIYTYDTLNRLISVTDPLNRTITYAYDPNGNRIRITTPEGVTTYTYNRNNQLIRLTNPQGKTTTYQYDPIGNQTRVNYPNNTYTIYTYNNRNWLTNLINHSPDGIISSFTYTYDLVGNRTKVKETDADEDLSIVEYVYDALYRLTAETRKDEDGEIIFAQSFTYDRVGNRLRKERIKNDDKVITEYHYNKENQLVTKITNGEITTYTYDANGNQTSKTKNDEVTTYEWDYENRLIKVTSSEEVMNFAYDGDGNRVEKLHNGKLIKFLNDINLPLVQVVMEFHIEEAEEEKVVYYTRGNTLISMRREGASYFYHYDGLGSVRQLTDSEGEVEEEYLYDAFGNLIEGNNHDNPYGFTGEQQFREADGLVFSRARYYDPSVGRFVSRDPILKPMMGTYGSFWFVPYLIGEPQRLHPYVYVSNNPVNWTDPSGLTAVIPGPGPIRIIIIISWLAQCEQVAREVGEDARRRYPRAVEDNHMRHCVAICELARRMGRICAWIVAWENERRGEFTWEDVRANRAGGRCAWQTAQTCVECCEDEKCR
jgi:RHS repeat-associated protein